MKGEIKMKWKILIVDDEYTSREFLKEYILNILENVEIFEAGSADEGLNILHKKKSMQIVFLDLVMPGMDAFEFLKKVKEINSLIQVIITTANNSYNNILNSIKNGADDYLIKPFSFEDIKEVMEYSTRKLLRWKSVLNRSL